MRTQETAMDETATSSEPQQQQDLDATSKDAPASQAESQQYDQMAKAASSGLMAHTSVDSAVVEISGEPGNLVFHLQCTLIPETDPSGVMELVAHGVIPNVERMLDQVFVSRDLHFNFAPSA